MGEHEAPFLVYLAVWEQAVSAIQAPELIDPALGAGVPDTTRRTQVRWLPMAGRKLPWRDDNLTLLDPDAIIRAFHECNADPRHRPMLAARAHSGGEPEPGPETAPTAWGYRGVENQLYRVEIHRGGDAGEATFKWSRDNGSVEFGLDGLTEPDGEGVRTATLRRAWYDTRQGLEVGDWVEFVDDHWAPLGWPAALMQVTWVSLAMRQVKLHDTEGRRDFDAMLHPLLRRWDQHDGGRELQSGIPLHRADRRWFEIEDGVQIWFEAPRARCEHGDYWLIPARTATNGVLWPQSRDAGPGPLAIPPNGPARYLAPLVLLRQPPGEPVDLRVLFGYVPAPVTETVTPPPAPAGETGTPPPPPATGPTPSTPPAPPTNPATAPAPAQTVTPPAPVTEPATPAGTAHPVTPAPVTETVTPPAPAGETGTPPPPPATGPTPSTPPAPPTNPTNPTNPANPATAPAPAQTVTPPAPVTEPATLPDGGAQPATHSAPASDPGGPSPAPAAQRVTPPSVQPGTISPQTGHAAVSGPDLLATNERTALTVFDRAAAAITWLPRRISRVLNQRR